MNKPVGNAAYVIANATAASQPWVIQTRAPNSNDVNYNISQVWLDQPVDTLYYLSRQDTASGALQSIWIEIGTGSGMGTVQFLQGNSGGQVGPDGSGTVNTIGSAPITVVGNPGANTLTVESDGTIATTYSEDAGSATPSAGTLHVHGGTGIATSGAGSTVTINAAGTVPLTFNADTASAVPSGNVLTIAGGSGIATSGAGSTITVKTVPICAFFAYLNTTVSNVTGDGTRYTIIFDATLSNLDSAYNTATGIFTPPVTGYYQFNTSVSPLNITAGHLHGAILFNVASISTFNGMSGNPVNAASPVTGNSDFCWTAGIILHLTAANTVSVQLQVTNSTKTVGILGNSNGGGITYTSFSGFLIAAG